MSEDHAGQDELATKCKFETVWKLLSEIGVSQCTVSFSGEGDSGSITDTEYFPPEVHEGNAWMEIHHETIAALHRKVENIDTGIERDDHGFINPQPGNFTLQELIHHLVGTFINADDAPDWVNNDGGYGTVKWFVDETPQRIEVEYQIRVVSTEDYTWEYDRHGEGL